jgi:hypothetical protein
MVLKTFAAPAAAALLFVACNSTDGGGTNTDPVDGDFDFKPSYTAPKGTVYNGDYFPLPATQVAIAITLTDTTSYASNGMYRGTPVDTSGTTSRTTAYTGLVKTLPAQSVTLPSGSYRLVPEATGVTESGTPQSFDTVFYEKTAQAVNLRATASDGGPRVEEKFLFLKLPLTVGDTWSYGKTDSGITSKGRYYVTGLETITAGGKTYRALRLDQEGKAGGTYDDKGVAVTYESHIHQVAWLVEGIGQVKQTWRSETTSTRVTSGDGIQLTLGQASVETMTMEVTGI